MARIYKTTDRIQYKIGEITVSISPLSVGDKNTLSEYMIKGQSKQDVKSLMEGSVYVLQCAVKDVKGLEDSDGNEYKLQFDESNKLTRECAEDLLNLEQSTNLLSLCSMFINGVPTNLPEGISLASTKNKKAQK